MKSLVCLFLTLGIAYGSILPIRPNCMGVFCTMDLKICPNGRPAPIPVGGCCPSLSACKNIEPIVDCTRVACTMDLKICPDGTPAPIPVGGCCPSLSACNDIKPIKPNRCALVLCASLDICPDGSRAPIPPGECCPSTLYCNVAIARKRSSPLSSLGSLLSGSNLLQSLSSATHGTNLGTVVSILNLLNNVHQLSNDIHQIPLLINETITNILNGTGQATQVIIDQLVGLVAGAKKQESQGRDLLGVLGHNANLLTSVSHLLPKGTSISSILSILNLLNNINALNQDIHQIPAVLNQTLASIVSGAGQAGEVIVQQLMNLIGGHSQGTGRDLLGMLGHNANLLTSVSHLLPKGTSISSILSILNLLNNINALNQDIHQIPAVINQTLASIVSGAGQAGEVIVQQLLNLVGHQSQNTGRDLLGALSHNSNLLSTVSHLLPQGTSISTILSLLNLLNNVNTLNTDLHQIPTVLQETLQSILQSIQNNLPPTIQPV